MLPLGVPVTILQGDEDEPVPPIHATSYLEAAEASGDRPRMILLSGVDHFVVVDPLSSVWPRIRAEILSLIPR
jgi:pimeloyl-ACP methyl ester carboxylesterase